MRKSSFLLSSLFVFLSVPCLANAAVSVKLDLDRTEATLEDSIRLVVRVSGTQSRVAEPVLSGLEDFITTQGGTSSRLEITNGKVNAGIDYTYFLQPQNAGTYQIGPAEVTIKGKTYRSNTAALTILKQSQSPGVSRGPLFLSASVSSQEAYVEEQILYTLKLYRRVRVADISLDLPDTEHLPFKQIGEPIEYQSVYQGQSYNVLEVRYALVPSKQGNYTIAPSRMNLTVFRAGSQRRQGLFDDPFFRDPFFSFSSGRPTTLASEPLELQVLPLPTEGRPADFTGLVGSFEIEAELEPITVKVGESATLTVFLTGRGNVNRIPDLKVPKLENIKIYADQPVLEVQSDVKGLRGSKSMKWALVPEKEGLSRIPPVSVSFFDAKTHKYREIKTAPFSLLVLPAESGQQQASAGGENNSGPAEPIKQEVKELARDILPIHTSVKDLSIGRQAPVAGSLLLPTLLTPPFLYILVLFGVRHRKKSLQTSPATKAKKAAVAFLRRYRREDLSSSELSLSVRDYLNDRFGLTLGALTPAEGAEVLRKEGVSMGTTERLQTFLQKLEDAIYTGTGHESCNLAEDVPALIKQIEKEVR